MIPRDELMGCAAVLAEQTADAGGAGPRGVSAVVEVGVILVGIASAVGVVTKFVRIPYTVALVLAGLALAMGKFSISSVHITEDLVLTLFLPPLLFQAGLHMDLQDLRRHWRVVALLAVPGVVLTTSAAAAAIRFLLPRALPEAQATWAAAFILGSVVAPTDPISVLSIFKSLGVPRRLRVIVEGESLFNDGTAAALFTVLKAGMVAAAAGALPGSGVAEAPGVGTILVEFLRVAGIGTVLGLAMGTVAFGVLRQLDDHTLETGITISLAWGSFLLAETLGASGVIAVLCAALLIGNYGKRMAMSEETRTTLTGFWDSIDFVVNSVVFLLVGLELSDPALGGLRHMMEPDVLLGAGAVYGALLAARFAKVFVVARLAREGWPRRWNWVISWAGLRGGLSLALTLGLPPGELRSYLLPVVFLVVLVTLLGQATTMPLVIRLAGAREPVASPT